MLKHELLAAHIGFNAGENEPSHAWPYFFWKLLPNFANDLRGEVAADRAEGLDPGGAGLAPRGRLLRRRARGGAAAARHGDRAVRSS